MKQFKEDLARIQAKRRGLDSKERYLVKQLRTEGFSWGKIAGIYGISRQACRKKFPDLD